MPNEINWSALRMVKSGRVPKEAWNRLVDIVHTGWINNLNGGLMSRIYGVGTNLDVRSGRGGGEVIHAYKGFDASETTTAKVKIQFGTHNDVVPKIGGVALSVNLGDNVLNLADSDLNVYVQLDLDEYFQVTAASIHASGSSGVPDNTETTAYQLLFGVGIATDGSGNKRVTVGQNVSSSQRYNYCGGSHQFWRV